MARPRCGRLALATIAIKMLGRESELGEGLIATPPERILLIPSLYWLNWKTLVWPMNLAISYSPLTRPSPPRRRGDPRRRRDRPELCDPLAPQTAEVDPVRTLLVWSGFGTVFTGHRPPNPSGGPILVLAVGGVSRRFGDDAERRLGSVSKGLAVTGVAASALVVLLLSIRNVGQVRTWRDNITIWEHCVKVGPDNAHALDWCGNLLIKRGRLREGEELIRRAMQADWNTNPEILHSIAIGDATRDDKKKRNYGRAIQLATRANETDPMEELEVSRRTGYGLQQFCGIARTTRPVSRSGRRSRKGGSAGPSRRRFFFGRRPPPPIDALPEPGPLRGLSLTGVRRVTPKTKQQAEATLWPKLLAAVVLTYLVCAAYWPILGFGFTNYDVGEQLLENVRVHGVTTREPEAHLHVQMSH